MIPIDTVTADTETGGLYAAIHSLLAIGAKCSWSEETFLVFVNPQTGKRIEEAAAKKNGYTPERWAARGAMPIDDAIPLFLAWVAKRKEERPGAVLLCHHLAFDKGFLQEGARVLSLELPHRNDWVCSQVEFTKLMRQGIIEPGSSSLDRLKDLSGWNEPRAEEHDALEDARITEHGYRWLNEQASARENGLSELAGTRLLRIKELEAALNRPEFEDFNKAVPLEAAHQVQHWVTEHDAGKEPQDWFWLIGYVAGKALRAVIDGNREKALHHCVTIAACACNWHAHLQRKFKKEEGANHG